MKYYIYALQCPLSKQIRYIGQTVQKPKYRFNGHIHESKNPRDGRTRKINWIRKLIRLGELPELLIIEDGLFIDQKHLDNIEINWISYYKNLGYDLVNSTDGGNSVCKKIQEYQRRTEDKIVYSYNEKTKEILSYKNIKEAAKIVNIKKDNIPKAIHIKGRCKELFWSYDNDFSNFNIKPSKILARICVYNDTFYKEYDSIVQAMYELNIPKTCRSRVTCRLNDGLMYKGFYFKRMNEKNKCGRKQAHVKLSELRENPEVDNPDPSIDLNDQ